MANWRDRGVDAIVGATIFIATLAYLALWPRDFYVFDEGLFLYEAKRVLDGQVMYRDFFEIVTPASLYLIAGLYALLGVSLETARTAMAVAHALVGTLLFLVCRQLGVRRILALLIALLHMTLAFPAQTIATPHWMSSALGLLLLLVVLRQPCTTGLRALHWGALCGLLMLFQQQRAIVMTAGAGVVLLLDVYAGNTGRSLARRAALFAAGLFIVVAPVMLGFALAAGFDNVTRALILHPIRRYPRTDLGRGAWGQHVPGVHPLGPIIGNLPLLLPVGVVAALWQWRARLAWPQRRPLAVVVVFSLTALLSVSYNPNYVHFAYVSSLWFALAALLIEMGLCRFAPERATTRATSLTAAALTLLVLATCWQLAQTLRTHRAWLPIQHQTAFGRVDLANQDAADYLDWLTELLRRDQVHELFTYGTIPGLYLLTGTENPTRFQILLPYYTERDQLEEMVAVLEARRVRYLVRSFYPGTKTLEPLYSYVQEHYRPIDNPPSGVKSGTTVLERRPDTPGADSPF
jgi:hypothetical protein